MQRPTLPGLKVRVPLLLSLALSENISHTVVRCALQDIGSARQRPATWHSASAFCAQNSVSVTGLPPPPPPQPASSPANAAAPAAIRASFRLVMRVLR